MSRRERLIFDALAALFEEDVVLGYAAHSAGSVKNRRGVDFTIYLQGNDCELHPRGFIDFQAKPDSPSQIRDFIKQHGPKVPILAVTRFATVRDIAGLLTQLIAAQPRHKDEPAVVIRTH